MEKYHLVARRDLNDLLSVNDFFINTQTNNQHLLTSFICHADLRSDGARRKTNIIINTNRKQSSQEAESEKHGEKGTRFLRKVEGSEEG